MSRDVIAFNYITGDTIAILHLRWHVTLMSCVQYSRIFREARMGRVCVVSCITTLIYQDTPWLIGCPLFFALSGFITFQYVRCVRRLMSPLGGGWSA